MEICSRVFKDRETPDSSACGQFPFPVFLHVCFKGSSQNFARRGQTKELSDRGRGLDLFRCAIDS